MQNPKQKQKSYSYCLENELTTRLLSEQEASTLAGVSLETLTRYQEFGLLKPVFRNELPFYRENEVNSLFMLDGNKKDILEEEKEKLPPALPLEETLEEKDVPTLSGLLSENLSAVTVEPTPIPAAVDEEQQEVAVQQSSQQEAPVPAVRLEDLIFENRSLKDKLTNLEDERDWLRKRVEQLEERSGREQMLLLSEKETLREVLNATVVNSSRLESSYQPIALENEVIKKPEQTTLRSLAKKLKNFLS